MKVYAVSHIERFEGSSLLELFLRKEKAVEYLKQKQEKQEDDYYDWYQLDEWEVVE